MLNCLIIYNFYNSTPQKNKKNGYHGWEDTSWVIELLINIFLQINNRRIEIGFEYRHKYSIIRISFDIFIFYNMWKT